MLSTPILFIVFNRPDTTHQVFEAIRQAKPKKLFVAADGPRINKEGEKEICEKVRNIATAVDWDCELKTLFRTDNMGCGKAVSTSINWFFENVEQGIILEDDCLPDNSFFNFCEVLLEYYKDNEKIMHISGNNFQFGKKRGTATYYFSIYSHIWGWATWKRAWEKYDFNMNGFDEFVNSKNSVLEILPLDMLNQTFLGKLNTWDVQWLYSVVKLNGLAILPNVNLVRNIGFNSFGTHTTHPPEWLPKINQGKIESIIHPVSVKSDKKADAFTAKYIYGINSGLFNTAKLKKALKKFTS